MRFGTLTVYRTGMVGIKQDKARMRENFGIGHAGIRRNAQDAVASLGEGRAWRTDAVGLFGEILIFAKSAAWGDKAVGGVVYRIDLMQKGKRA